MSRSFARPHNLAVDLPRTLTEEKPPRSRTLAVGSSETRPGSQELARPAASQEGM